MADYTDFELSFGPYGKATEYTDENAIILAIRNILLSNQILLKHLINLKRI